MNPKIKKYLLLIYRNINLFFQHYIPNHIILIIPSYRIRHSYYRYMMKIKIGKGSSIHMGVFIFENNLTIGSDSCINRNCHLDSRGQILIGNNVSISPECVLITGSHSVNSRDFDYITGTIIINDYVWLGTRALILPNIEIGKGAVICAGAVVTKNVKPYTIVAGVPAKEIGKRTEDLNYNNKWFMPFD